MLERNITFQPINDLQETGDNTVNILANASAIQESKVNIVIKSYIFFYNYVYFRRANR